MRRVKHILTYVLVLSMCFTLFSYSFIVSAESATYFQLESGCNVAYIIYNNDNTENRIWEITVNTDYVRMVVFKTSNSQTHVSYLVSNQPFDYIVTYTNNSLSIPSSCTGITDNSASLQSGYYIYKLSNFNHNYSVTGGNVPIVDDSASVNNAIYYTFGEGAVDPEPSGPTYGKPYDVEYSTRIAGSGLASADNIDRIVWNRAVDTNGNELPTGARVQIRAIPGKYVGNTANDVLTKTYTDFVLDHSKQLIIVDIIASRGVYETKWSEVVDHFGFFPYSWVPNIQYVDNEYFKMGWIYQIRLQVDDYYSDWTNIYTATGSGAAESQTITDSDEISQQLVTDINIINQLNNTTTTNWYINETTINNSEYTENTNGKPWWAYLLEAILSLFQIDDGNQQTINNTNNLNIDLNDKLEDYNEIEDQQLQNLDTNLDAIEVESDMLENNKFIGSANWVATQYTRMTNGTVIGSLIGFSLLFGLALIFIGKIR